MQFPPLSSVQLKERVRNFLRPYQNRSGTSVLLGASISQKKSIHQLKRFTPGSDILLALVEHLLLLRVIGPDIYKIKLTTGEEDAQKK